MANLTPHDILFPTSPEELRDWLEANHAAADERWVGFRPRASGLPTITWPELVDEVLCVGWIDGVRKSVEGGSAIRITPRREGSIWSARNVGRVEALRAEGRMRPAGEAAFGRRRADRTAIYSFEQQAAFDDEANAALDAAPGARPFWERQPPGYRRSATHWVMSAKRPETKAKRLAALVEACAGGERVAAITGTPRPGRAGSPPG
jgi:uncharacterized protein YdeI (YjbR/CyaY-like superfamily)